ncbi:hypothetical protein [Methylobacterium nigriterrae]|uniref:hypothetical protein n=1 Tax=Methylobacterium nigriterrae TaxID=3127512 RepID=UPI0030139C6F
MTKLAIISAAGALTLAIAGPALAQATAPARQPGTTGTVVQGQPNTTGNDANVVISRGATGAGTATTNSAAGGNAGQPERAVPQGSANGGSR